ncbi:Fibronectin type III domain-containing protein [Lachnospiraceae bacterium]|nr:Fibronectin type III domain-containing protein [Lachnospiraceae bacterium]
MKNNKRLLALFLVLIMILGMQFSYPVQSEAASNVKVTLSDSSYEYTGKACKPKVKVRYKGKKLSSKNYTVKYASGRKKVGKYSVKIKLKGKYSGSKTVYFTINPQKTEIQDIQAEKEGFSLNWTKVNKQLSGYQIAYSKNKDFSDKNTFYIGKVNSYIVKGLEGGSNYYVKIRTYAEVKGKKYYSEWSDVKTVTTIKVYRFRSDYYLKQHYDKHGKSMGFASAEEYEAAASDVVLNPESLHKTEKEDGDDCYYLEATNDFVVVSTDGYIRTYFRPDSGKSYFDKQ